MSQAAFDKQHKRPRFIIGVDFDGTCVEHEYPNIGDEIGADKWLRRFWACGAELILWTMRCDGSPRKGATPLTDAVNWFRMHSIPLFGVNENPEQRVWTSSPKAYCHRYIDDAAFGIPLTRLHPKGRPFVDWKLVGPAMLVEVQEVFK